MSTSMVVFLVVDSISILLSTSEDIYQGQPTSTCQGKTIVGGYNNFGVGAKLEHTYTIPDHFKVQIKATILLEDSWLNEVLTIKVDGQVIQTYSKGPFEEFFVCGNDYSAEKWFYLDWTGVHTSETLTLLITSNLDENPDNESWGITDLQIYFFQENCYHLYSECNYQGTEYVFCAKTPIENQEEFILQIRSMKIPYGNQLQLQNPEFLNGDVITYSSNQLCVGPFIFPSRRYIPETLN